VNTLAAVQAGATRVHTAAVIKAERRGDAWLAGRIHSGVPASLAGRKQEIEIGPKSGLSNVKYWLRVGGYAPDDETLCQRLFDAAKTTGHTLATEELEALIGAP